MFFCWRMPYSNSCNKCDDSTCFPGHNSPKASDAPDTWECSNDRFTGTFVKSNEAGIGLNNSAQIPDFCYFLRKWWTWQSFNKAILLSFPSPERDKECILQRVPGVNRFRDRSTLRKNLAVACSKLSELVGSKWRYALPELSTWPTEPTTKKTVPTWDCFKLAQQHVCGCKCVCVCVCMCFFVFWHVFLKTRFFCKLLSRLLHSSAKRENMGKTADTLMTRQWSSSPNEERAYSTNFFVKKQPKQSDWTKVWFHKQSQQPFIRFKKARGNQTCGLELHLQVQIPRIRVLLPIPHSEEFKCVTFTKSIPIYSSKKTNMFFYHLWLLHRLPPIPWHPTNI